MWCAPCYSSSPEIDFYVREKPIEDEEEERFEATWRKQWDESKYLVARNGDHLMTPFECDRCVFVKLKGRLPTNHSLTDKKLAACVRRVNLDAFWARESSTIANNLRNVKQVLKFSKKLGLAGPFSSEGPMPFYDHCGYEIAVYMVLHSTQAGRHNKKYVQFETIRQLRTCFGNFVKISSSNVHRGLTVDASMGLQRDILNSPTNSLWFRRFFSGCRSRMGQIYRPNLALPTSLIIALLHGISEELAKEESIIERFDLIIFGCCVVISHVLSLRGSEGLMLDLTAITKDLSNPKTYCAIGLKGKIKGESAERDHLFPCSDSTSSGMHVRVWLKMLCFAHKLAGRKGGPAITTWSGEILSAGYLDGLLHSHMFRLWEDKQPFPPEIKSEEDIIEMFSFFRSLR